MTTTPDIIFDDPQEQKQYESFKATVAALDKLNNERYSGLREKVTPKPEAFWSRAQQDTSKAVYTAARKLFVQVRDRLVQQVNVLTAANQQLEQGLAKVQRDADKAVGDAKAERDAARRGEAAAVAKQRELQAIVDTFGAKEKDLTTKMSGLETDYNGLDQRIGALSGRY